MWFNISVYLTLLNYEEYINIYIYTHDNVIQYPSLINVA